MGITDDIKGFLSDDFNRMLTLIVFTLCLAALVLGPSQSASPPSALPGEDISTSRTLPIHYFYAPTCPHCIEQKPFNSILARDYPKIKFIYHDVTSRNESDLLQNMSRAAGYSGQLGTPTTIIGNTTIVGFKSAETTGVELRTAIENYINNSQQSTSQQLAIPQPANPQSAQTQNPLNEFDIPFIGKINPMQTSLPVLAIVLGLIDGFNPCAMWVLVYLIGLTLGMNDRKRVFFIAGSFVLSSGILYFLFMTAWLNAFLFLGYVRPVMVLVGGIALIGGVISLKEYLTTKDEVACKVGDANEKKKQMSTMREIVSAPMTLATLGAIIILAFAVNSAEFVCSSAIPAVFTQVLALSHLSTFEYYSYILLYDIFFMLDDLIVFGLAAFAVTSGIGEKYARYCKAIGGAIMLALGLILLFAPNLLR